MENRKRTGMMIGLAAALLAVVVLGCTITASAKARLEREEMTEYFRRQERELVREVREYLAKEGYRDSGVTLTRTCFEDGSTQYKLTVHHRKIDRMNEEQREELLGELGRFTFLADRCEFIQEFLILE